MISCVLKRNFAVSAKEKSFPLALKKFKEIRVYDVIVDNDSLLKRVVGKHEEEKVFDCNGKGQYRLISKFLTVERIENEFDIPTPKLICGTISGPCKYVKKHDQEDISMNKISLAPRYLLFDKLANYFHVDRKRIQVGSVIGCLKSGKFYRLKEFVKVWSQDYGGESYDSSYYVGNEIFQGEKDTWVENGGKEETFNVGVWAMETQQYYPVLNDPTSKENRIKAQF